MTKQYNAPLERKEAAPKPAEQGLDLKNDVKSVMTAFEEFKSTNDARIAEIEKKGGADPILEEKLNKINAELDKYEGYSEKLAKAERLEGALEELKTEFDKIQTAMSRTNGGTFTKSDDRRTEDWARAVISAHITGVANLSQEQTKALKEINDEYKALSVSTDTAGGYLAPVELVREIIKGETEMSPVRTLARVRQTAMKSVSIPKRTGQFSGQWVAEQGTKSETTGLAYGLLEIPTHELYALVDISNQMLEDSAFSMESEITMESVEQFAVAEGAAFVNGDGIGKPKGFMQSGLSSTNSGAATAVTADGLITAKHAIKTAYTANAHWLMNRTTLGSIRKLKTTDLQYIWMPGLAQGRPNTIDGDPYVEMSDMPSEGAGLKPVAYGDFRRAYTWVDRISMEMLRDPYTQATAGNVRFIVRKRVGGQVVLAEALQTVTCST